MMQVEEKHERYQRAMEAIDAILDGESQMTLKMATINCILQEHFPSFFWVGFYCMHNGGLVVGPYQGTLGCLHISLERGICGRAARLEQTQIVADVHSDPAHIACDSRTNSEIVVPVHDPAGRLIAVLDIDSTAFGTFDEVDQAYLEAMVKRHFREAELVQAYAV